MKLIERLLFAVMASLFGASAAAASTVANPIGAAESSASNADADTAWAETAKLGTLEAYTEFAMRYPDSRHIQEAYNQIATGAGPASEDQSAPESMDAAFHSPAKRSERGGIGSSFLYII